MMNIQRLVLLGMLKGALTGAEPAMRGTCEGIISRLIDMESETPINKSVDTQIEYEPRSLSLTFYTRQAAEDLLTLLETIIKEHGMVTVYDLNHLIVVNSSQMDFGSGWLSVKDSVITKTGNMGYMLTLPPVIELIHTRKDDR